MASTTTKEHAMQTTTNPALAIAADIFIGLRDWKKKAEGVCDINEVGYPIDAVSGLSLMIVTDTDGRKYEITVKPI
jgi:hypothetical protein